MSSGFGMRQSAAGDPASRSATVTGFASATDIAPTPNTPKHAASAAAQLPAFARIAPNGGHALTSRRLAWAPARVLPQRRAPTPSQHAVERPTIEVAPGKDDGADLTRVVDVIERIGVEQHEIGELSLLDSAHVGEAIHEPGGIQGRGL